MSQKDFSPKSALKDVIGGVVVGGLVGAAAALRALARPRAARGDEASESLDQGQGGEADVALADELAPDETHAARPTQPRPGWQLVEREPLPRPTYWPAALAFGLTLLAWGIATTWIIASIGGAVIVAALAGWIGELRHGH